jgi:hypothetical protein
MSASDGCPKCGGAMSRGFVVDHNMGAATVGLWVGGEPVHIRWGSGVKAPRELSDPDRHIPMRKMRLPPVICETGVRRETLMRHSPSLQLTCDGQRPARAAELKR